MEIKIPIKNDNLPYSRIELEQLLREQLLSKNHMYIRKFALSNYGLNPDYYITSPIILVLHWLLDRMIDDVKNKDSIKVVGEKMGLSTNRQGDSYKIKGFDPKGDNSEFMLAFIKQLANFISRNQAMMPSDSEGVGLEELNRFIEPDSAPTIIMPVPPPGVILADSIPLLIDNKPPIKPPPAAVRRPRGRPAKVESSPSITPTEPPVNTEVSINLEYLVRSFKAQVTALEERLNAVENSIPGIDSRIFHIEKKINV